MSLDVINCDRSKSFVDILALPAVIVIDNINELRCYILSKPPAVGNRLTIGLRYIEKVSASVALTKDGDRPCALIHKPAEPVPDIKLCDFRGIRIMVKHQSRIGKTHFIQTCRKAQETSKSLFVTPQTFRHFRPVVAYALIPIIQ